MAFNENDIQDSLRTVRKLLKTMPTDASAHDVHRFRTNSRRIEALLPALSLDSGSNAKHMLKQTSKLRRQAGKVRDLDVLTAYVSDMPKQEHEKECSVHLLEYLGARRWKQAKKLHALKQEHGSELRKRLQRVSEEAERVLRSERRGKSSTAETVAASTLKLSADLLRPARLGRTNLHPYRLRVKELRNLLQMAENADRQEFVRYLGEVKDAIGEWHDWEELIAIAKEALDHGLGCRLLRSMRKVADSKYRNAIALSERMRKKFLQTPHRRRSSGRKAPTPARAVLSAASALVA